MNAEEIGEMRASIEWIISTLREIKADLRDLREQQREAEKKVMFLAGGISILATLVVNAVLMIGGG